MHQTNPHLQGGAEARLGESGGFGGRSDGSGGGAGGGGGGGHTMSLMDKLNTMSRVRRRRQEAEALASEARQAMEDPLMPITPEIGPVGYQLAEGDECSMLEPHSKVSIDTQLTSDVKMKSITYILKGEFLPCFTFKISGFISRIYSPA